MNIKKELKKEAKNILPDENFKKELMSNLGYRKEQVLATNSNTNVKLVSKGTIISTTIIITLIVVFVATLLGIFLTPSPNVYNPVDEFLYGNSYINIQINPGFEIKVDKNNYVLDVTATNSDGALVLYGIDFKGMSLNKACNKIIKSADRLGFLEDTSKDINIIAFNEDATLSKVIGEDVKSYLDSYLEFNNSQKNTKLIGQNRQEIEQIALSKGISEDKVKSQKAVDLVRTITDYDEEVVMATNAIITKKIHEDPNLEFESIKNDLNKADILEDLLEDILDYLEDVLGEEEDDDEDEESEEDELEPYDSNKLSDLINSYNYSATGIFESFKYELKIDLHTITQEDLSQLEIIRAELDAIMDGENGLDDLEDQLEDKLDTYKANNLKNIK